MGTVNLKRSLKLSNFSIKTKYSIEQAEILVFFSLIAELDLVLRKAGTLDQLNKAEDIGQNYRPV